ncbi:hypothetical protein FIBSPDRAFT_900646 [Athelia psychrophila]|uniref:Uncharacterized protein n=1 Tax=Athelia psychrophila TaxID=1759441 RepID=A0A165Y790_9AGAM|nr:hypothetical protein FIBSPDRAFT_900646 [Fibularhizoctonia sp. CBS 109695]
MTAYCSDIDTCRTLRQIIQPAVSALIASTYLSVHQNINRRGLPWYSEAVNTVIIIIVALLVPEWIFMWALRSYIIARRTQRELEQARSEAKSEWGNPGFVGNLPLASDTGQRGYGIGVVDRNEKYTIAHAFFVNMGGLLMYDLDGNSYGPLDMGTTIRLIRGGHLLLPRLERLQGVSKTTTFGQSFAAAQLFSFLLDCSVRICQGLPLADFEIMAYAHAWIAVASFGFWWVKPQNVSCAEVVSIEVVAMANDPDSASEPPANIGRIRGFYRTFPVWQVVYAFAFGNQDSLYSIRNLASVPMFWSGDPSSIFAQPESGLRRTGSGRVRDAYLQAAYYTLPVILFFGAVHCIGWNIQTAAIQRVLWRGAAVAVAAVAVVMFISYWACIIPGFRGNWRAATHFLACVSILTTIVYIVARVVLLVISCASLGHLAPEMYISKPIPFPWSIIIQT